MHDLRNRNRDNTSISYPVYTVFFVSENRRNGYTILYPYLQGKHNEAIR